MEKLNYKEKLNAFRLRDDEGDLGHTIHISNAIDVCAELENHYLTEIVSSLTERLAALEKKNTRINELKELVRSAHEIATREGKETNWEAFRQQCKNLLS